MFENGRSGSNERQHIVILLGKTLVLPKILHNALYLNSNFQIEFFRVFYEHMDGENRVDRLYLIAEAVSRQRSRIPFWLTIRTIMKNDNIPRLVGNNVIEVRLHFLYLKIFSYLVIT